MAIAKPTSPIRLTRNAFFAAAAAAGLRVPEADQQVAADAHAFPEDVGQQVVVREHQPGHREDEQADHGEEPGIARVARHVARPRRWPPASRRT